jgi:DNA-binding response OmpR family regulator
MYLLSTTHYDCLLLDLILKEESGLAICREVRNRHLDIPILIYSILDDPYSKVLVLEAGADDMVSKSAQYEIKKIIK